MMQISYAGLAGVFFKGAIDHPHLVVVELLRGSKDFADGCERLVTTA